MAAAGLAVPVKITPGGIERQDSVRIALELTSSESATRDRSRRGAAAGDACNFRGVHRGRSSSRRRDRGDTGVRTLKRVADSAIVATVARAGLWQAQTPQAFRREALVEAHRRAVSEGIVATDDADLVERTGVRVEVVEPSTANLKITTPSDLAIVEAIIAARK